MKFEDFIGFIISLAAFIFLMIRSAMKKNQAPQEAEEELQIPAPPPVPQKKKILKVPNLEVKSDYAKINRSIVERYSGTSVVSSHYANIKEIAPYVVTGKDRPSRAYQLIAQLKSRKNMVILKEIIGPPKGFR